jgi:SAM-dependent methyltransferase
MFRGLRWWLAKKRLACGPWRFGPAGVRVAVLAHDARPEDLPPNADAYDLLASVWDRYGSLNPMGYGCFLGSAADYYGQRVQAVLDLACGTGLLTRRLAGWAGSVVGLDASEGIVREARCRTPYRNVRYIQADFREFDLGEGFDAAVCSGDSLNYVGAPAEVIDVFRCVHRHLRPGGLFAFDVLDHAACVALAGAMTAADVGGRRFEVYYFYDRACRVSEGRVAFGTVVERHRRIPLEEQDIRQAAAETGLEVVEQFASKLYRLPGPGTRFRRQFYVLRRP